MRYKPKYDPRYVPLANQEDVIENLCRLISRLKETIISLEEENRVLRNE